jgi:hypothetical protein
MTIFNHYTASSAWLFIFLKKGHSESLFSKPGRSSNATDPRADNQH